MRRGPLSGREVDARGRRVALGAAIAALTALAWRNRFVQDDAFISFRYARHLVEGHGLVWNPGERVEGYTNFQLGRLGVPPPDPAALPRGVRLDVLEIPLDDVRRLYVLYLLPHERVERAIRERGLRTFPVSLRR